MSKERNTNIEALRLFLMFSIVMVHLLTRQILFSEVNNLYYVDLFFTSFVIVSVNVFVFISGYYGIYFNLRSLVKLIIQALFYSVSLYIFSILFLGDKFSIWEFIKMLFPFSSTVWWFMSAYIGLYAISPILNIAFDKLSKKKMKWILVSFLYLNCFSCFLYHNNVLGADGYTFFSFVVLYCLARYLNIYKVSIKYPILIYFTSCILIFIINFIVSHFSKALIYTVISYNNPLIILGAVALFYSVLKFRPSYNATINKIAGYSLAVYLIHSHPYISDRVKGVGLFIMNRTNNDEILNILFLFLWGIIIFVVCLLVEHIRLYLFKPISQLVDRRL